MKEIDKKLIETISRYAASGIDQQVANLEKDRILQYQVIMNDTVNDTVNSKEQEVLNIIKQYPGLNSSKIAELIGKSTSTAKRYLNSLVRLGIIEFRGAQKTGGYFKNELHE